MKLSATEALALLCGEDGRVEPPRLAAMRKREAIRVLKDMVAALRELRAAHIARNDIRANTVPGAEGRKTKGLGSAPDPERKAAGNRRAPALRRCVTLGR